MIVLGAGVVLFLIPLAVATTPLIWGVLAGNGAALLLTCRWLRRWERDHRVELLREPRFRWSRGGRRSRGMFDPQDFYAASQPE